MAYYRDLREFLAALESRGKLVRVKRNINKDTELSPLVRLQYRGLRREERRAFLFESLTDSAGHTYGSPVAIGALAGTREIYALGMQCEAAEVAGKINRAAVSPLAPRIVASGPAQEEVHSGAGLLEHGGLGEFPIPVATPGFDPAPYLTAPCFVSKDPESGIPNVGMYRSMVKAADRLGVNFYMTTQGGYIHWDKCRKLGRSLQAAIVIGGPPSVSYVAAGRFPRDLSEFGIAGAIAGDPLELVRCRTVDIEVPAQAEIVIEGLLPTDQVEPEAPFGEVNGFVSPIEIKPFMNVTCITHRRRPVWVATLGQFPPSECHELEGLPALSRLYDSLREVYNIPNVLEVGFLEDTGSIAVIRVDEAGAARAWEILSAAKQLMPARIMIAVNSDVNVRDARSVFQAVVARTQPYRDYRIERFPARHLSDYSLEPMDQLLKRDLATGERPQASTLLIDATLKWPLPPVSLPGKQFMEDALRIWREEGLPQLSLVEPWQGVNLGYWTEEHERHARAAVSGDPYLAGRDYEQQRRPC